jgi:hypothetical protein
LGDAIVVLGNIRNPYPFGHANYTGGFALLALPWFASLAKTERGPWRVSWIVGVSLSAFMIFSSGSRGALLGLLAMLVTTLGHTAQPTHFISQLWTQSNCLPDQLVRSFHGPCMCIADTALGRGRTFIR